MSASTRSTLPEAGARATLEPGDASGGAATLRLAGRWTLGAARPDARALGRELRERGVRRVLVTAGELEEWDTALLSWLSSAARLWEREGGVALDRSQLPAGVAGLLQLAERTVEPPRGAPEPPPGFLARVGARAWRTRSALRGTLGFIGRVALALARFATGRARYRGSDLLRALQGAGADAVPITTLVSVIVGAILAFVGVVQLRLFGADLYVADLVGVAMVREMGSMVVAILMAGRTGAAYAAQLATMKVTEEIDALKTSGIPIVEFLVVPRVVGLFAMMPFLCLYSIALGITGGALVGVGLFGISRQVYFAQTFDALSTTDLYLGVFRGLVYGLLIGIVGCRRGLQAGDGAGAVGQATTSAVVTAVVAIVVADGVMAVVFDAVGL